MVSAFNWLSLSNMGRNDASNHNPHDRYWFDHGGGAGIRLATSPCGRLFTRSGIVNKANPVDSLSFADLRAIFLGERGSWPNGKKITVLMRSPGPPEREAVLRWIYKMNESDYSRYSLQSTFTGQAQSGPKLLDSAAGMRRFVFNVPGAIGYVRAPEADESVKILRIDGHAPGEAAYRIKLAIR